MLVLVLALESGGAGRESDSSDSLDSSDPSDSSDGRPAVGRVGPKRLPYPLNFSNSALQAETPEYSVIRSPSYSIPI